MQRLKLGSWIIESDALRLISPDGRRHPIGQRAMAVLTELIAADGALVEKSSLLERAWDGVVVTENSLNQAITELRQTLEDDPRAPKYIETVRGRGYRLLQSAQSASPEIMSAARRPRSGLSRKHYVLAASLALALLAALFIGARPGSTSQMSAVSPDGEWLAHLVVKDADATLYVVSSETGRRRPLSEFPAPESRALAWSPDSTRIIFNATQSAAPNYAINIVSRINDETMYIKFAKDPARHEIDSVPEGLGTPETYPSHTEWSDAGATVHRIELGDELLVILFEEGRVAGFNWSTREPGDDPAA